MQCTLTRLDTSVPRRSLPAFAVRQVLLSAPPTEDSPFRRKNTRLFHGLMFFRYFGSLPPPADNRIVRNCDAHVPRYIHISAFPNGVRYSVLASLVLTSPIKSDMLILVCTTTASSCAVHAHASRHFRASPLPAGVRCKASPVVRTTDGRLAFSAKIDETVSDLVFFPIDCFISDENLFVRSPLHLF